MTNEKYDIDKLEAVYNKLDDFRWLIQCVATCHFDEFDSEQFGSAMFCFLRLIEDIETDLASVIKKTYPD